MAHRRQQPRRQTTLVPAVSFTLTNVADRPLGALQVNALFYLSDDPTRTPGIAFLYAVGWRGLASRATSPSLMVRPHSQNQPAVVHWRRQSRPFTRRLLASPASGCS